MINNSDKCQGLITRSKKTINGLEQAVLDFYLVNERMVPYISEMIIDEAGDHCMTNFNNKKVINSDHKSLILHTTLDFSKNKS